ncbi:MAG: DUF3429 domain-containing protein [Beijerinckiaceae bacterium]|nr:DUF3429 domain-containing protein [Beijerinckiaceae bacterium]
MTNNQSLALDQSIPVPALLLGAAGLIPFVGSAACLLFAPDVLGLNSGLLHMVLVTYAALIASFLGGVRWGNALAKPEQYGREFIIAVMPSLVAWLALATPRPYDLMMLIAIFLALGVSDIGLVLAGGAPRWYGKLRVGLTAIVVISLLGALLAH